MEERKVQSATEVRDFVIDWLRREFVGPAPGYPVVQTNGEEILRPQDPPRYRYACGILFPRGVRYSASVDADAEEAAAIAKADPIEAESEPQDVTDDEEIEAGPVDAPSDSDLEEVAANTQSLPSSMGLSFLVQPSGGLALQIDWAVYTHEPVPGYGEHVCFGVEY